jgi:hypothetical protein
MTDERVTRPELAREAPVRDPAKLWASAASARREQASSQDEASVGSAYDVIERYMKEGQRIAAKFGDAYSELDLGENVNEMQARWFELTGELMANWFDLLGAAGERRAAGTTNTRRHPATPEVEFEVKSRRRARFSARFSPGAQRFNLSGPAARCENSDARPIRWQATSTHDSDSIRLCARIKAKQPPGHYTANIVNANTGEILGSLTIDVL